MFCLLRVSLASTTTGPSTCSMYCRSKPGVGFARFPGETFYSKNLPRPSEGSGPRATNSATKNMFLQREAVERDSKNHFCSTCIAGRLHFEILRSRVHVSFLFLFLWSTTSTSLSLLLNRWQIPTCEAKLQGYSSMVA